MIRILVVDDHPIVRQGLVAALGDEADFAVVGAASSAEEALALIERGPPDLVLLDLELPGLSGLEAIPRLLALRPECRILVFTAYDTDERVLGAVRAGARGYLLKGATAAEIARGIRAVAAGGSALTPRERQVLGLIARGLASKEIARELRIKEPTVKFHTAALLRKLGADNRAQAVALAAQRGLLGEQEVG